MRNEEPWWGKGEARYWTMINQEESWGLPFPTKGNHKASPGRVMMGPLQEARGIPWQASQSSCRQRATGGGGVEGHPWWEVAGHCQCLELCHTAPLPSSPGLYPVDAGNEVHSLLEPSWPHSTQNTTDFSGRAAEAEPPQNTLRPFLPAPHRIPALSTEGWRGWLDMKESGEAALGAGVWEHSGWSKLSRKREVEQSWGSS